jgi:hypothetical protein
MLNALSLVSATFVGIGRQPVEHFDLCPECARIEENGGKWLGRPNWEKSAPHPDIMPDGGEYARIAKLPQM